MGDTEDIRNSLTGMKLMEEGPEGIYVGPKDGEDETDVFVTMDLTHLTVINGDRSLEISRQVARFLKTKELDIKSGMVSGETFGYTHQLDNNSILKVTNDDVPREMIDVRVWYTNCVGRLAPTKKGARLHYIHLCNIFALLDEFLGEAQ